MKKTQMALLTKIYTGNAQLNYSPAYELEQTYPLSKSWVLDWKLDPVKDAFDGEVGLVSCIT